MNARLVDGLYAIIHEDGPSKIMNLAGDAVLHITKEDNRELAQFCYGQGGPGKLHDLLEENEILSQKSEEVDAVILDRLCDLGAPYSYRVAEQDKEALALMRRAHARRKAFVQAYGQTPCLPETSVARARVVANSISPKSKILVLGDDDLMGVALSILGFEVVSVDIDPMLIDFLKSLAKDMGLPLSAEVFDLLACMNEDWIGGFDAVFTDPMSFADCLLAFNSRALAALRSDGFLFTTCHADGRRNFAQILPKLPATIAKIHPYFSAYYGDGYTENFYRSDLIIMRRDSAPLAYAPDSEIPLQAITEGQLSPHRHASTRARLMRSKKKLSISLEELTAVIEESGVSLKFVSGYEDKDSLLAFFARDPFGHFTLRVLHARNEIIATAYPADAGMIADLQDAVARLGRPMHATGFLHTAPRYGYVPAPGPPQR